ncbi:hypothetical protein BDB00DRAFT_868209 [Zychaea mexicana]|uniref:uncharacterized protein n=1 Tax=Zychaea mexicana TaxID=64656 RepID=UPI0022FEEE6F|nr:uncharacterized protein BDB00DRAFT_868209 [Zychaea mexicana]KAI9497609.1 hypothetical protein BDB00DRAFT_868209 [Zychaea mexicana]
MSIPVQAATSMFAPQPVRANNKPPFLEYQKRGRRSSSLDKNAYFEFFKRNNTPNVISDFLLGWSSAASVPHEEDENNVNWDNDNDQNDQNRDNDDNSEGYQDEQEPSPSVLDRPAHPLPPDATPQKEQQQQQIEKRRRSSGSTMDEAQDQAMRQLRRQRGDSVQIGIHINDLLDNDDVKQAVNALQEAVQAMNMTDLESGHDNNQVVHTYSTMLQTLCEQNMARVINQISGVDLKTNPDMIYGCIMWRMFTKVIEAGYTLQYDAYMAVTQFLMDNNQNVLALQALYSMPRGLWDIQAYKLAISLHLIQKPQQVQQAEWLLSEFGKPYLQVANPLAPTLLPPLKIETPLMKDVTEQDRYKLWMFYQSALSGTEWAKEKETYEEQRRNSNSKMRNINSSLWKDWALRRMSIETEEERIRHNKIDNDNAMIYTASSQKQFEYGWGIYVRMGETVDEFTPRVVMHLCWRAFSDTPLMSHVSLRSQWESRAWEVYARFMCSEHLHPDQPETPGFLCDLILITAFSPQKERYTKTQSVYQLLRRLELDALLRQDQVLTPVLCVLLIECQGAPASIMDMCHKAFEIWQVKTRLDARYRFLEKQQQQQHQHRHQPIVLYSLYWALLILCIKSGSVSDFVQVLQSLLLNSGVGLPTSLVMTIQTFHDRYLCKEGEQKCYFHEYLLRTVQYVDKQQHGVEDVYDNNDKSEEKQRELPHEEEMNAFGFVREAGKPWESVQPRRKSVVAEPIAYVDHALHQRSNIHETLAAYVAMAASIGAAKDEYLPMQPIYSNGTKAKSLIRHCFEVGSKKK